MKVRSHGRRSVRVKGVGVGGGAGGGGGSLKLMGWEVTRFRMHFGVSLEELIDGLKVGCGEKTQGDSLASHLNNWYHSWK